MNFVLLFKLMYFLINGSTAVLRKVTSFLVTRVRKGIQADGGHIEQLA
jgi:hypothetical protein